MWGHFRWRKQKWQLKKPQEDELRQWLSASTQLEQWRLLSQEQHRTAHLHQQRNQPIPRIAGHWQQKMEVAGVCSWKRRWMADLYSLMNAAPVEDNDQAVATMDERMHSRVHSRARAV